MYFNLALSNVKKSYKDYMIYFLTLTFSICLFYTFNSFQSQQAVMELNEYQNVTIESLAMIMTFVSIFIVFVLAFLILYANNFLIKRRKKELGIYTLLGMPRAKISRILVYETLLIGFFSLLSGMIIALFLSQILTVLTASLFEVNLNYSFVFSVDATTLTILAFSCIFLITMIFNSLVLNRYKLIDLMTADRKNEHLKIKNIWVSVIIFLISIAILGTTYAFAINKGLEALNYFGQIVIGGVSGTFLFFMSLSGFLLTLLKSMKGIYFKNLNSFVLRQINSNINTNFMSMSFVCIMLLLSIGALSTGLNLNESANRSLQGMTPYDYTYRSDQFSMYGSEYTSTPEDLRSEIAALDIDKSFIKSESYIDAYLADSKLAQSSLLSHIKDKKLATMFTMNTKTNIMVVPLSSYNQLLSDIGKQPLSLATDELYVYSTANNVEEAVLDILAAKPSTTVYGHELTVVNSSYEQLSLGTEDSVGEFMLAYVVADEVIPPNTELLSTYWNVNVSDKITSEKFAETLSNKIQASNEQSPRDKTLFGELGNYREGVSDSVKGISIVCIYIGIYLGIIFLIASSVVLALQQLSQANDNKKRYQILSKIGASKKMIHSSIFIQIGIYFLMPLILAIVHSIVGIQVVNHIVQILGKGDIFISSIFTGGVIVLIYGAYFLVTYIGYKNVLKS